MEASKELNAKVAELLGEPKPADSLLDPDAILDHRQMSPKGLWAGVSLFYEGDIPKWSPMPLSQMDDMAFRHIWPWLCSRVTAIEWADGRIVKLESFLSVHGRLMHRVYPCETGEPTIALALCAAVLAIAPAIQESAVKRVGEPDLLSS